MKNGKRKTWLLLLAAFILTAGFGLRARAADSSIIYDTDNVHDGTVGQYYETYIVYYSYNCILDGCVVTGTLPPGVYAYVDAARNWVVLKGTPTTVGEFSFGITGIADDGTNANAMMRTVKIAASNIGYNVSTTYCQAKHEDGHIGGVFAAGELVTLVPNTGKDLFVDHYVSTPGLTIPTGYPGERVFGLEPHTFYMPAQNVSVYPVNKIKNLGSYSHNAAATDTGILCGSISIATMNFAIDHGLIWAELDHEDHSANMVNQGDFLYFHIDLDKDGTADLEMDETYGKRWTSAGYGQAMSVLPGRSVYGTFTLNIPVEKINQDSDTGLYSQIVFNMGAGSAHTHSLTHVPAKEATCTAAGNKEHYECSCGSWFWDAGATNKISNHADAIIKPGHKMKVVTAVSATCTTDGVSWHVECEKCGNWYWDVNGTNLIPDHSKLITKAYGHKWSEWTVVKPATETEEGLRERHCYNFASHKEQEAIPKLTPAPTEPATTEAPTEPPTEPATTEAPAESTETPTEPASTEAPTEAPTQPAPTEPAPTQPAPTQPAPTQPETQSPQKEGGGNTVLWILLGVMAVIASVLGGILIGRSGKKDDKK